MSCLAVGSAQPNMKKSQPGGVHSRPTGHEAQFERGGCHLSNSCLGSSTRACSHGAFAARSAKRQLVEADPRRAARLHNKVRDEIDPQVRMGTPEGYYSMAVTLPKGNYCRRNVLRSLSLFLV
jgi:hypothetical protein